MNRQDQENMRYALKPMFNFVTENRSLSTTEKKKLLDHFEDFTLVITRLCENKLLRKDNYASEFIKQMTPLRQYMIQISTKLTRTEIDQIFKLLENQFNLVLLMVKGELESRRNKDDG